MTAMEVPPVRFATIPDLDADIAREISRFWWPLSRLGEGIEELVRRSHIVPKTLGEPLTVPSSVAAGRTEDLATWFEWAAGRLGVEAEAVDSTIPGVPDMLRRAAPAVLLYEGPNGVGFCLLMGGTGDKCRLLCRDLKVRNCRLETLRTALCWHLEAPFVPETLRLLNAAGVPSSRQNSVRAAMLRERLASVRIDGIWILRPPATAAFWQQLVHAHVPHKVGAMLAVFAGVYALEIFGWSLIGNAALNGSLDLGWLLAWLLLVLSVIPLRTLGSWFESIFALESARILKSRLLAGALRMDLESVTRRGVGHLLCRVMESQALEALAINGGVAVLVAILELLFAAWILSWGAASFFQLTLLAIWLGLTLALSWRYYARLRVWAVQRLDMSHDLIERMVGHRTRLAQERSSRRDAYEDSVLQSYLNSAKAIDHASAVVFGGVPSGWLLVGLLGLVPSFTAGNAPSTALMAISLGGILVAQRAFSSVAAGLGGLARAAIAWEQVAEVFAAGRSLDAKRPYITRAQMSGTGLTTRLIDVQGLSFRYEAAVEDAIHGVDLEINRSDRILLEGESGGGKSTLGALLSGLRTPTSGLLLLNGLDRHTLDENWHRLATMAPQFHENHILSGSLAFNLLMGREWPASESDLQDAEALCQELGLGELIRRMPAGLMQRVGETGWQLSHGERSRIFLARALLQNAQLTIMDESFGALDPKTLALCLQTTLRRAQALIVIAHP